jgi:DNA processing protein
MSPREAAALAILGVSHRRFLAVFLRVLTGQSTEEDADLVPMRIDGESVIHWAYRCRYPALDASARSAEVTNVLAEADQQLATAARGTIAAIPLGDPRYPARLAAIPDPPPMLWLRGDPHVLVEPAIAIVGSRASSTHGLEIARQLATDLTAAGVVIVSGLARGVDSAAHVAAVRARGRTIAVLGSGPDRIYPDEHRDLATEITEHGAVVSEFPPGIAPLPYHFPLRNRIISGLSQGVVVVEAPEKSGSLITAAAALEQGRDVMVVPGPVIGRRNCGGHRLIRDGAKLVESADDILLDSGIRPAPLGADAPVQRRASRGPDFTVDEVAARSGVPAQEVLARLLELELSGKIQRIGGGRFMRV